MVDEIKGKGKVGDIKSKQIEETRKTGAVKQVGKTSAIDNVKAVSGNARGSTRVMTAAEREKLFKMVNEEAEKLFGDSGIPQSQRQAIEDAVKYTLDAAIIDDNEDDNEDE